MDIKKRITFNLYHTFMCSAPSSIEDFFSKREIFKKLMNRIKVSNGIIYRSSLVRQEKACYMDLAENCCTGQVH